MSVEPLRSGLTILALIMVAAIAASCSSGPPEVLGVEWTLESRGTSGSETKSLSVFARVQDPDGIEDIEAMWIINDAAELCWSLDASSWLLKTMGEDHWIGAADLAMPDGSGPPTGMYRVIIADLAGNRTGSEFKLDIPSTIRPAPKPRFGGGQVRLDNPWPENYLLAYDASGTLLRSAVLQGKEAGLAALVGTVDAGRTAAISVYGYDSASRQGAFSARIGTR